MKFYEVAKRHWFLLQYREALILGKLSPQRKIAPYKYQAIIVSGSIYFFLSPMAEERRKTIWYELEANPGPLASQGIALTTRPCLFGHLYQVD